ncbi:hypothetical protein [Nocardia sp. NPDC050710]|uniref:hypothetical protein n=1 Tax=Nocardia sp. NPDC050710 TaxID=3157220 RepID=UPI0033DDC38F
MDDHRRDVRSRGGELNASAYEHRKRQIDEFLKSGVHQSYPWYVVGPDGITPLTWLRQRLIEATSDRIGR